MAFDPGATSSAFGFLTVVEHPQLGLFGGYLVLNTSGRPVEFHCTAPLKPNRAQEILYGPTLKPYLYGEQIGRALVTKATTTAVAICTDCEPVLELRELVPTPVVLVVSAGPALELPAGTPTPSSAVERSNSVSTTGASLRTLDLGRNRLAVRRSHSADADTAAIQLAELGEAFDLTEPFGRIRDAIEEAGRASR